MNSPDGSRTGRLVAFGLVGIVMMLILPIPPLVLDVRRVGRQDLGEVAGVEARHPEPRPAGDDLDGRPLADHRRIVARDR